MRTTSQITINVILVGGTVALLQPFLRSLETRTMGTRFRLVANGCRAREIAALHRFCESDNRFEVLAISRRVMPHGRVLDELLRSESSPVLAFMDSDCFVTEDPFKRVVEELGTAQATFSGEPCWRAHWPQEMPEGFTRLIDAYRTLADGTLVGSTFFAAYHRREVASCVAATGVSFVPCHRSELPAAVLAKLDRIAPGLRYFDTGKALNLMLGLRGARLSDIKLPGLWHVGGTTSWTLARSRQRLLSAIDWLGVRGALYRLRRALAFASPEEVWQSQREREQVLRFNRCRADVSGS